MKIPRYFFKSIKIDMIGPQILPKYASCPKWHCSHKARHKLYYGLRTAYYLSIILFLFVHSLSAFQIEGGSNAPIAVEEVAVVTVAQYPTTAVVPLSHGRYNDVSEYRVSDASGKTVPAQFRALNRWWFKDNSIRHLEVRYQPSVGGTGAVTYYLRDDGNGNSASTALSINESQSSTEVVTGPLKFTVNKARFTIIEGLWLDLNGDAIFDCSERMMNRGTDRGMKPTDRLAGDIQLDSDRSNIPPNHINNLAAARTGTNIIKLVWTAPQDAIRYHIVYSDKPISESMTTDANQTNWWAANTIGPDLIATPGVPQSLAVQVENKNEAQYVAMFSFDGQGNMSAMSNVAIVLEKIDQTPPSVPQSISGDASSHSQINLLWLDSIDPESGISRYDIYRDGLKIGESTTNSFSDEQLSESTVYAYELCAVSGAGVASARSMPVEIETYPDTIPPILLSARASEFNKVIVSFNEVLEQASAETVTNYKIDKDIVVLSASLASDLKTVTLFTSPHEEDIAYTLTVANVTDRAANAIVISSDNVKRYKYYSRLIGYWKFDESSGDIVADSSGGGNNGNLKNGPTWTAGIVGSALSFDGLNNYIVGNKIVNTPNVSVVAWIKVLSTPLKNMMVIGFIDGLNSVTHDKELYIDTDGRLRFYVFSRTARTTSIPATTIPVNEWVQVAGVANDTTAKTYVNGAEVGSVTILGDTFTSYTVPNIFMSGSNGSEPDISYFHGLIDEVRVYGRALSADEILNLYNSVRREAVRQTFCSAASSFEGLRIKEIGHLLIDTYARSIPPQKGQKCNEGPRKIVFGRKQQHYTFPVEESNCIGGSASRLNMEVLATIAFHRE